MGNWSTFMILKQHFFPPAVQIHAHIKKTMQSLVFEDYFIIHHTQKLKKVFKSKL